LLEDYGLPSGGDGPPCNTFILQLQERLDPENYKHIQNQAGGLHQVLNGLQKTGQKFGDRHLREFLDPHRDSDKKKDWYLNPGDPNQMLLEQPEMVSAHYVSAARHTARLHEGNNISPVDVDDHMLKRAQEHDNCMIGLAWLNFVNINDMVRDSEQENDPELYRTAGCKLATLLFAKTNASKYVRMAMYYWIRWQCSSDAYRTIHGNFLFTKNTSGGKTVLFDRFEEWFNEDIRRYLGKYKRSNQELACVRAALLTTARKRAKLRGVESTPVAPREKSKMDNLLEKSITVTPIFCHKIILIERLNLWGEGPVLVGKDGAEEEPTCFCDPSGRNNLNTDLLFDVSAGSRGGSH
jgi:hypothetical protein